MGLFSGAKAQIAGQKALRAHISANELAQKGKPEEAGEKYREVLKMYEAAIRDGNQKPNVHQGYAILLVRLGEYERAMEVMQKIRLMKEEKKLIAEGRKATA